jgi:hypothetical protein
MPQRVDDSPDVAKEHILKQNIVARDQNEWVDQELDEQP